MEFSITTDKSKIDVNYVHETLSTKTFWALGREKEIVEKSIEFSMCFSIFENESKQVGFARVITDHITFAYLSDVFIDEDYRGRGLGQILLDTIYAHPDLQNINRWMLLTKDAHGLYEKYGFKITSKADWIMDKVLSEI